MQWFMILLSVVSLGYSSKIDSQYKSKHVPGRKITSAFHIPRGLERSVDFWIDIFSKYDIDEIVIYDAKNYLIYEIVDVSDINSLSYFSSRVKEEIIDSRVTRVQKKYGDALINVHKNNGNPEELNDFLYRLYVKFDKIKSKNKFLNASRPGRIRSQKGHKANFKEALYYSGKYLPTMEKIFKRYKIPTELTRLPFVESFFNPKAVSSRNASGIWQFMKKTGKEYLKVKRDYDERNDPVISTHAAAKLLKQSYKYLYRSWPLAVTAYNHGRFGIKRATKRMRTKSLVKLINKYKSKTFGFASKNFYAEFLAALFVEKNHKSFFKDVNFAKMSGHGLVITVKSMKISQLELLLDVDREELRYYNPALSDRVFNGKGFVPKGAKIRIPIKRFKRLLSRAEVVKDIANYVRFI